MEVSLYSFNEPAPVLALTSESIAERLAQVGLGPAELKTLEEYLTGAGLDDGQAFAGVLASAEALASEHSLADGLSQALKNFMMTLGKRNLSPDYISNDIQVWSQLRRNGVPLGKIIALFGMVDRGLAAYLGRNGTWSDGEQEIHAISRNLSLFYIGLLAETTIGEDRAVYQQLALYDPHTGLPNQLLFSDMLRDMLQANDGRQPLIGLLIVETKPSHKMLGYPGYPKTEQLIVAVAKRMTEAVRERDLVGQLSAHELIVALPSLRSEGQVMLAANKILRVLEPEFVFGEVAISVRTVIGAAISPSHGNEPDELIRAARVGQQAAQSSSENYVIYHEDLDSEQRLQRSIDADLRAALRENELMLYYQPQLDLASGRVRGAEALLRWKNRRGQFVPPNIIVSVAEQSGLAIELTRWVLNTALRHMSEFLKQSIDITVSVNLTATDIQAPELVETVQQCLRTWNVPPQNLLLEITEGSMIHDIDKVLRTLQQLHAIGLELSIDDFGTGYSSLAYLKRLPIQELKIDQLFVRQMMTEKQDERIVRTILDLAHNLDLRVVAEGVEDQATLEALRGHGCDCIQGYLLSRPIPQADFVSWLTARNELAPSQAIII